MVDLAYSRGEMEVEYIHGATMMEGSSPLFLTRWAYTGSSPVPGITIKEENMKSRKDFDIDVTAKGKTCTKVILKVNTGLSCELPVLHFTFECGQQFTARLLKKHIQEQMETRLAEMRKTAYETGWRDKLKKKPKRTDFYIDWDSDFVGY